MAIEIRESRADDEAALVAALGAACGRPCAEEWRWAGANPAGRRSFLALDGGRVVGHYACVPRRVWIAAREAIFAEVAAPFAAPAGGRGLQRAGTYARLAQALAATYGQPGGDLVHHGFPALPAWRVDNGQCEHEVVRNQTILLQELAGGAAELPGEIELVERFDHQAKWLWDRCAGKFGAAAIRDEVYLNWRFVARPSVRYERLGLRDGQGILRGCAVYRAGEFAGLQAGWLVDWIVPPEEPEVGELLLRGVRARARAGGQRRLAALLPEWSPWFEAFQTAGFLVHPGGIFLAARAFSRKFDEVWLRDQWWFTPADSLVL